MKILFCKINYYPVRAFLSFFLMILILSSSQFTLAFDSSSTESQHFVLEVSDNIGEFSVDSVSGEHVLIKDIYGELPLLILYVRDTCSDCVSQFENYSNLVLTKKPNTFDICFIWDGNIPQDELQRLKIPIELSYTTNKEIKLNNWVPTYFVMDESGIVAFKSVAFDELQAELINLTQTEHAGTNVIE